MKQKQGIPSDGNLRQLGLQWTSSVFKEYRELRNIQKEADDDREQLREMIRKQREMIASLETEAATHDSKIQLIEAENAKRVKESEQKYEKLLEEEQNKKVKLHATMTERIHSWKLKFKEKEREAEDAREQKDVTVREMKDKFNRASEDLYKKMNEIRKSSTRQTETQFEVWDDEVESILQAEKSFQQRIIEHIQHHRVAKNSAEIKQKHALRDKNLLEMDLSETQHSLQASREKNLHLKQQLEASKLRIQDLQGTISATKKKFDSAAKDTAELLARDQAYNNVFDSVLKFHKKNDPQPLLRAHEKKIRSIQEDSYSFHLQLRDAKQALRSKSQRISTLQRQLQAKGLLLRAKNRVLFELGELHHKDLDSAFISDMEFVRVHSAPHSKEAEGKQLKAEIGHVADEAKRQLEFFQNYVKITSRRQLQLARQVQNGGHIIRAKDTLRLHEQLVQAQLELSELRAKVKESRVRSLSETRLLAGSVAPKVALQDTFLHDSMVIPTPTTRPSSPSPPQQSRPQSLSSPFSRTTAAASRAAASAEGTLVRVAARGWESAHTAKLSQQAAARLENKQPITGASSPPTLSDSRQQSESVTSRPKTARARAKAMMATEAAAQSRNEGPRSTRIGRAPSSGRRAEWPSANFANGRRIQPSRSPVVTF